MPEPKLMFDECISRPSVERLGAFVPPSSGVTIGHMLEHFPSGTHDEDWVVALEAQGWTIVSADGARRPNAGRGRKLPTLCGELGITLVTLSPTIHARGSFDRMRTILSVWDELIFVASDPSKLGRRYMLEPYGQNKLGLHNNKGIGQLHPRRSSED